MKKILVILVGGTICCEQTENGALCVGKRAGAMLIDHFNGSNSPFAKKVRFDLSENLFILSENMTVSNWNRIINMYKAWAPKDSYDGIIFAHGTDTLGFSAALFAQLLSNTKIPVFFVSANKPLDHPKTNGGDNFKCAVECIVRGIQPNVWVTYKNISDSKMYLHLGSRLQQCPSYSDDFYSHGALDITDITEENYNEYFNKILELYHKKPQDLPIDINGGFTLKNNVLLLDAYVGINYAAYNYSLFKAVLHTTYHSGTACAQTSENGGYENDSILYLKECCAKNNPPADVYLAPSVNKHNTYETVSVIANHRPNGQDINFLYGYTKETAYAKLVIAYSAFTDKLKIKQFIENENNFERVD